MKAEKIIKTIVKITVELDITGATLLTIEEAKKLPEMLREYKSWWWLKSPGLSSHSYRGSGVYSDGFVSDYGEYVHYCYSVRPALIISNLESSSLQVGDTFEFGGKEFEIISNNRAFCLSDIGISAFRNDRQANNADDYEKSDVKKFIDNWFEKETER